MAHIAISEIPKTHAALNASFNAGKMQDLSFRRAQILLIQKCISENLAEILDAEVKDGKAREEAWVTDLMPVQKEVELVAKNMESWLKTERTGLDYFMALDSGEICRDPLGVVFIIGTWNYPVNTSIVPLIGAIAAGNCALVKFSEVCENVSQTIAKLFSKYLDSDCFRFVNGAIPEVTEMLKLKWDHIFYTGNGMVGRVVARAAAEHLTPVTLELGGKSPVFIDGSVDMRTVTNRLAYAKFMNNGQTCVAADYILLPSSLKSEFLECFKESLQAIYGNLEEIEGCEDYARIISDRHWQRLNGYLNKTKGKIVVGGKRDRKTRFIQPTVIFDVQPDDILMSEEIFGPLLPVVTCESLTEAIQFIRARDKPLAAYLFSNDLLAVSQFKAQVLSGGMVINDTVLHYACSSLPFGGVGASGYGMCHGKHSVMTFSHAKAVLWRSSMFEFANSLLYPPYTKSKIDMLSRVLFWKARD